MHIWVRARSRAYMHTRTDETQRSTYIELHYPRFAYSRLRISICVVFDVHRLLRTRQIARKSSHNFDCEVPIVTTDIGDEIKMNRIFFNNEISITFDLQVIKRLKSYGVRNFERV